MSHITPIFKNKGSPADPSNYRPISLTGILCKIMEKILFKYIFNNTQEHNILSKNQSGFQPRDCTVNQLVEIYNIIISNLDQGKDVRFVFCDISKAFDKVWHKGLLFKLEKYGFKGDILGWIENYLHDRCQKVMLEGFSSGIECTNAGVPQGSVLGPFLFLIYINDIIDNLENQIRLFADDTSLFVTVDSDLNSPAISLTNDLNKIRLWSAQWLVSFNPSKTVNVNFSRRNRFQPPLSFGNNIISECDSHCHLGLVFQSTGVWSEHVSNIYKKACQKNAQIQNKQRILDKYLFLIYTTGTRVWRCSLGQQYRGTKQTLRECTDRNCTNNHWSQTKFIC